MAKAIPLRLMASRMPWFGTLYSTAAVKYESKTDVHPYSARVTGQITYDSFTFPPAAVTARQTQACHSDR